MKKLKLLLIIAITTFAMVNTTYALPLTDKVVDVESVTTENLATTTEVAPVLTKEEKKTQRKMERMKKRVAKFMPASPDDESKTAGIVAYITLIGWLVSLLALHKKGNDFSAFHLRQALGIFLVAIVGGLALGIIPILGLFLAPLWALLMLVVWIIALVSAINGTKKPVFLFGEKFQDWFSGIS